MERIDSIEDEMKGVVTYALPDGRRVTVCAKEVSEHGWAKCLRAAGVDVPTGRIPVMRAGEKVGYLPNDFDPENIRSASFLYDPRSGDFRRDGDTWIASPSLGLGDLEAVPGFRRFD